MVVNNPEKIVTDIDKLIEEIIPPVDYQHRNGFSNENIILSLSEHQKLEVEDRLIKKLSNSNDELIGETLAILKSKKALPILNEKLSQAKEPNLRIIWASFINEIEDGNNQLKNIAFEEFRKVSGKYILIDIFYYASRFNDKRINNEILSYIDHKDYLVAYNARKCLGLNTKEIQGNYHKKDKSEWWKFWKQKS